MESKANRDDREISRVHQTRRQTRSFYDRISAFYDLLAEHSEEPLRSAGLAMLKPRRGERILEIGVGTGHSAAALADAVGPAGSICGVDISAGMLARAKRYLRERGCPARAEVLFGDAVALPIADATMDAVFMSFTLELLDTPEIPVALAECRRIIRPNGRLLVVSMSKEGKSGAAIEIYEWLHRHFPALAGCRPIFVREAVEKAGFCVIGVERHKAWMPVEIVLGRNSEAVAFP